MLIAFEGLPGAGKTTQADLLAQRLREDGVSTAYLPDLARLERDDLGDQLFELFAFTGDPFKRHRDVLAETYLAAALRANIVATLITPALAEHQVVIEDRGAHTMYSYSLGAVLAHHRSVDLDQIISWIKACGRFAGPEADLSLRLVLAPEQASTRHAARSGKTWTVEQDWFLRHVDHAYSELERCTPQLVPLDARGSIEDIHEAVYATVTSQLADDPTNAPVSAI